VTTITNIYFVAETTHIPQHYAAKPYLRFHGNDGYVKETLRNVTPTWSIFFSHVARPKTVFAFQQP
jgi:hypothetical protein